MKILNHLVVGLGIGFVFTTAMSTIFMGINEVTIQFIAWAIASGLFGLSALVFENNKRSLLASSAIHYVLCLIIAGVNIYLFYREYILTAFISFTITYLIIYIVMWQMQKNEVKHINAKLEGR